MKRLSRRQIILSSSVGVAGLATVLTAGERANTQANQPMETVLQKLLDRMEIIDTVNQVAMNADMRDWQACRDCFIDRVDVDYTSLVGGQPAVMPADDLIESWRKGLSGLKATQHMISNHAVTLKGDTATCVSQFQAQHLLPNDKGSPLWTLGGVYHHELVRTTNGWKVRKMKMTATWAEGNQQIMTLAAQGKK